MANKVEEEINYDNEYEKEELDEEVDNQAEPEDEEEEEEEAEAEPEEYEEEMVEDDNDDEEDEEPVPRHPVKKPAGPAISVQGEVKSPTSSQNQPVPSKGFQMDDLVDLMQMIKNVKIVYKNPEKAPKEQKTEEDLPDGPVEDIKEEDLVPYIKNLCIKGYDALKDDNMRDALFHLKKAEYIIDIYASNEGKIDVEIIMQIFNNLALCYYKIGIIQEAYEYIQDYLLAADLLKKKHSTKKLLISEVLPPKDPQELNEYCGNISKKLRSLVFKVRAILNGCIILSEMMRHEEALRCAEIAAKLSGDLALCSAIAAHDAIANKRLPPNVNEEVLMNYAAIMQHIVHITSYLRKPLHTGKKGRALQHFQKQHNIQTPDLSTYFNEKTAGGKDEIGFKKKKADNASAAGAGASILSIAQVRPIHWNDVFGTETDDIHTDLVRELSSVAFFQKIELLAVSSYCLATESRFMDEETGVAFMRMPGELSISEVWLGRSLELVYLFLPHESPLCGQIISVHTRLHGISKQAIPEDDDIGEVVKYLRPLKGGPRSDFYIPIIRCPSVPVSKKEVAPPPQARNSSVGRESENEKPVTIPAKPSTGVRRPPQQQTGTPAHATMSATSTRTSNTPAATAKPNRSERPGQSADAALAGVSGGISTKYPVVQKRFAATAKQTREPAANVLANNYLANKEQKNRITPEGEALLAGNQARLNFKEKLQSNIKKANTFQPFQRLIEKYENGEEMRPEENIIAKQAVNIKKIYQPAKKLRRGPPNTPQPANGLASTLPSRPLGGPLNNNMNELLGLSIGKQTAALLQQQQLAPLKPLGPLKEENREGGQNNGRRPHTYNKFETASGEKQQGFRPNSTDKKKVGPIGVTTSTTTHSVTNSANAPNSKVNIHINHNINFIINNNNIDPRLVGFGPLNPSNIQTTGFTAAGNTMNLPNPMAKSGKQNSANAASKKSGNQNAPGMSNSVKTEKKSWLDPAISNLVELYNNYVPSELPALGITAGSYQNDQITSNVAVSSKTGTGSGSTLPPMSSTFSKLNNKGSFKKPKTASEV